MLVVLDPDVQAAYYLKGLWAGTLTSKQHLKAPVALDLDVQAVAQGPVGPELDVRAAPQSQVPVV